MPSSALCRFVGYICMALACAAPLSAHAQNNYRRSPDYDLPQFLARLPKYCYAQYYDQTLWHNPEFSIIAACGVGMNHFCPGLLNIMRAEGTSPKKFNRKQELRAAKENVQYTLDRMPSSCIYRDEVMAAKMRVEVLEKIVR